VELNGSAHMGARRDAPEQCANGLSNVLQ